MAHLNSSYDSFETFLNQADAIYGMDLAALNSSGVTGTAILATSTEEDGSRYVNVALAAEGLTPDVQHAQHIHGRFDDEGNPIDSKTPGLAQDSDKDGMVEVLEGVSQYGDVLLPLLEGGAFPMTESDGELSFIQSYDLDNGEAFFSPVTGADYSGDDLLPLETREIVLHGLNVPSGIGAGTEGEVNGDQDGFVGLLPAAAGEIKSIDLSEALDILDDQRDIASDVFYLTQGDDRQNGGKGDDLMIGRGGDDALYGAGGNDILNGNAGADTLGGRTGDDEINGHKGDDVVYGNDGSDFINGGNADDLLFGGNGDDTIRGGSGNDVIFGGSGDDQIMVNRGDDIATGGDGSDTFLFRDNGGQDMVTDFDVAEDSLDLTAFDFGSSDEVVDAMTETAAGVELDLGEGTITFQDASLASFETADDWVMV